jgi:hypothetical protein
MTEHRMSRRGTLTTWFAPHSTGVVVLVFVLIGHLIVGTGLSVAVNGMGTLIDPLVLVYGYPAMGSVLFSEQQPDLERLSVHWGWLLSGAVLSYLMAMPLGRLVAGGWGRLSDAPQKRGLRRPAIVLLICAMAAIGAGFVAAIITSKLYWGYYLSPPKVDSRLFSAAHVVSLTDIKTVEVAGQGLRFAHEWPQQPDWHRWIERARAGDGRGRFWHLLVQLSDRGLIPGELPTMPEEQLASLHPLLDAGGLLESGDPKWVSWRGYDWAKWLDGYAIELKGRHQEPMIAMFLHGGEVSNDHYPYYEFVLNVGHEPPALVSAVRFFRDNAGIEGFEWPQMWLVFGSIAFAAVIPVALVTMLVLRLRERARTPWQGFPVQLVKR